MGYLCHMLLKESLQKRGAEQFSEPKEADNFKETFLEHGRDGAQQDR